jgi:hypothetical protein
MADDAAIVNVLNILGKNFTALSDNVTESSKRQESLTQQLTDSLKSIVNVQSAQLKLAQDSEKAAKERQTGLESDRAKKAAEAEKNKTKSALESIPGLGKVIKGANTGRDQGEALQKSLAPYFASLTQNTRNSAAAMLKFSRSAKQSTATGIRGAATRGMGAAAGGMGKLVGGIAKILPKILTKLGPLGIAAGVLLALFDKLKGAIGFLISGAIAYLGTYIFTVIEIVKDLIAWFKELPAKIGKFFNEDLPLLFEAAIIKLKETFTNLYNYLQETIFQPLADYLYEAWEGVLIYWDEFKAAFNERISAIADSIYETWEGVKIWYNEIKQSFNQWLESFADGLYEAWEGIIAYKDELMLAIDNMITNVKNSIVGMFESVISFIKEKIDAVLDFGGGVVDGVKGFFGFGDDEEPVKEVRELTPYDFPSGVINNNAPPVKVEGVVSDEMMERYNQSLEKNKEQSEQLNQRFELLINTIDKKDLGTTIINNTAPAPTQSYSNGGKVRK